MLAGGNKLSLRSTCRFLGRTLCTQGPGICGYAKEEDRHFSQDHQRSNQNGCCWLAGSLDAGAILVDELQRMRESHAAARALGAHC